MMLGPTMSIPRSKLKQGNVRFVPERSHSSAGTQKKRCTKTTHFTNAKRVGKRPRIICLLK